MLIIRVENFELKIRQMDGWIIEIDRQIDRQTDRQIDRQIDS